MYTLDEYRHPALDMVPEFMHALEHLRRSMAVPEWREFIRRNRTLERWRRFLAVDPCTRRGIARPRRPGCDAELLDLACGHRSVQPQLEAAEPAGRLIYYHTAKAIRAASACSRRAQVTAEIEANARRGGRISLIALACGFGRELEALTPAARRSIGRLTAVDADQRALEVAAMSARGIPVTGVQRSVPGADLADLQPASLVYSVGLLDGLGDADAAAFLQTMWTLVAPGGAALVSNLAPEAANLGYCEAIMDWWRVPRGELALGGLVRCIRVAEGEACAATVERHGEFNLLRLTKLEA